MHWYYFHNHTDPSLFILHCSVSTILLLLDVNDIILTSNSSIYFKHGILYEGVRSSPIFFLVLRSFFFILNIVVLLRYSTKAKMANCKAININTPVAKKNLDSTPLSELILINWCNFPQEFSCGALKYLTLTRRGLSFSANLVWKFRLELNSSHFQGVKRILCYIKGTNYGLPTIFQSSLGLYAFSDGDWAVCPITPRSTSKLMFQFLTASINFEVTIICVFILFLLLKHSHFCYFMQNK